MFTEGNGPAFCIHVRVTLAAGSYSVDHTIWGYLRHLKCLKFVDVSDFFLIGPIDETDKTSRNVGEF